MSDTSPARTNAPEIDWRAWLARWDRFQETYVPHRELQFSVILDYVEERANRHPMCVLDLGCGPGSMTTRILERFPEAHLVGLDVDPWLLEMARQVGPGGGHVDWVDADLRSTDWVEKLPHRSFDVVVSTTALHWFDPDELRRLYGHLATIMTDDGLLLIGNVMPIGTGQIRWLMNRKLISWQVTHVAIPGHDHWTTFWEAANSEPGFEALLAERRRRLGHQKGWRALPAAFHHEELARAGFRESGEVWRCHASAVLLAIR